MKIKFIVTLAALLVIAAGANAQNAPQANWVEVAVTDTATITMDKASLKRNGDIVTAWESIVDKKEKKSTRMLSEYNCKTGQTRGLSVSVYPSMDFTGKPITYPPQKDWSYVIRETIGEGLSTYACKNAPKGLMDYFK